MSRITSLRRRLCSAAAAMLAGLSCATAVAEEPIRIGSFLSVTGPTAYLGDPELKTLELYIEKLNAAGGLLGRHRGDPLGAARAGTAATAACAVSAPRCAACRSPSRASARAAMRRRAPPRSPAPGSR